MKIKETVFGNPDKYFVDGIDGKISCPFTGIEFLANKTDGETTLQKLGSDEYNSILETVEKEGLLPIPVLMNVMNRIMNFENANKKELEKLAVDTVAKNFGLPDEIRDLIVARLDCESDLSPSEEEQEDEDELESNLDEEQMLVAEELIKKRILQNALMMGSGYRAHKLFSGLKESLDKIDNRLYPLYENLLPSVEYYLWKQYIPVSGRVVWGKCEIVEENGSVKGKAQAKMFIILLHEVAKIAVEILFLQSIQDIQEQHGEDVRKYVIFKADRYEDEQWMKLIGPRLWKHLHDCMDYIVKSKGNDYSVVSYIVNTLGILYPENFFAVMNTVVNDGEKAVQLLEETYDQIMQEIEEYERQEEEHAGNQMKKVEIRKKPKSISDYSKEELNSLLRDAVENEEFEKAAIIKREIDNR